MFRMFFTLPSDDLEFTLTHCQDLYYSLGNQKILVTGGTGFFGKWFVEAFLYANQKLGLNTTLTLLTRDKHKALQQHLILNSPFIDFIEGDVSSFEYPQQNFDYLIHMATEASVSLNQNHPEKMLQTIIAGTQHILKFAEKAGIKSLLTTSSGAIYGPQPSELIYLPETFANSRDPKLLENNAYAHGKYIAESLMIDFANQKKIPVKIARCFAFIGPYLPLDMHFAIGNFIRDGLENQPIQIKGDGTPTRSYLYAADLIIWLMHIWLKGESCLPYNVGSDESLSIREVAEAVSRNFSPPTPVQVLQKALPGKAISRYVPNVDRAKAELSLKVYTALDRAIQKTIQWHLK